MEFKPIELIWAMIAIFGGIARYLNAYVEGQKFKVSIFLASAFVAGFSGFMFALLGDSLQMPGPITHIMAGVGGFFGEQTMKLIFEIMSKRAK